MLEVGSYARKMIVVKKWKNKMKIKKNIKLNNFI